MIGNNNNNAAKARCTYQLLKKMDLSYFTLFFVNENTEQAKRTVQKEKVQQN